MIATFAILLFTVSGCGYTTRSLLPSNYKSIYVENVKNDIQVSAEQNNLRMYRGYRPGMEIDLTNAIINRYILDGNLNIATEANANIILKTNLIDYKRDALRYDTNENVEEYRIKLIVNMELEDVATGNIVWKENGFSGETTYRTGGSLAKTESSAVSAAIEDLARRIVERTIEAW
jgi:hypothetical protein